MKEKCTSTLFLELKKNVTFVKFAETNEETKKLLRMADKSSLYPKIKMAALKKVLTPTLRNSLY